MICSKEHLTESGRAKIKSLSLNMNMCVAVEILQ